MARRETDHALLCPDLDPSQSFRDPAIDAALAGSTPLWISERWATVMGERDGNIVATVKGPRDDRLEVLTVYSVDDAVPAAALEALRKDERIIDVPTIKLNDE